MSLSINSYKYDIFGNKRVCNMALTFDSSYAFGGEALTARQLGMDASVELCLVEPSGGFGFEYDHTNSKLKVLGPAPPIVWEEQQTIATNAITLNYPAAYILYVAQADTPVPITDTGATLVSGQCKPTAAFAAGVRSGLTFSGLTGVVYVGYITQAWKEVWDNLIQGETQTTTTHVATLTNQAIAIQSIRAIGTTGSNASLMLDKDDTAATLEAAVNMTSTAKTITFVSTDVITSCVVTYIKKPAAGFLLERFIAEEAFAAASNVCTPAYPLLLWGYTNQIPENGAVTEQFVNIAGSLGTGEAKFTLNLGPPIITGQSITTGTGMYLWGVPSEIPGLIPLEVKEGTDLSALIDVRLFAIGT